MEQSVRERWLLRQLEGSIQLCVSVEVLAQTSVAGIVHQVAHLAGADPEAVTGYLKPHRPISIVVFRMAHATPRHTRPNAPKKGASPRFGVPRPESQPPSLPYRSAEECEALSVPDYSASR